MRHQADHFARHLVESDRRPDSYRLIVADKCEAAFPALRLVVGEEAPLDRFYPERVEEPAGDAVRPHALQLARRLCQAALLERVGSHVSEGVDPSADVVELRTR